MYRHLSGLAGVLLLAVACSDQGPTTTSARAELEPQKAQFTASEASEEDSDEAIFRFNRLAGNQGPLVGAAGAIRGVNAGGLPWELDSGKARLDENGMLRVRVEGLVLDRDDPRVPAARQGVNPLPFFRAILSCETFVNGMRAIVNDTTDAVDTDEAGNARIEAMVDVPEPCYAPVVFVTSDGGSWFAVSGSL